MYWHGHWSVCRGMTSPSVRRLGCCWHILTPKDRARLGKGNRYAAQRGLLRDELSGLFKSMSRDYMAGLKELIMTLYDCPAYLDSKNNKQMAEEWRASAHRLLADLGENEEARLENRILGLLRTAGGVATVRDLYCALRSLCLSLMRWQP